MKSNKIYNYYCIPWPGRHVTIACLPACILRSFPWRGCNTLIPPSLQACHTRLSTLTTHPMGVLPVQPCGVVCVRRSLSLCSRLKLTALLERQRAGKPLRGGTGLALWQSRRHSPKNFCGCCSSITQQLPPRGVKLGVEPGSSRASSLHVHLWFLNCKTTRLQVACSYPRCLLSKADVED
ncbi:hypothetical protein E2C01_088704 [Portunus trituberculatus]|uniref:Uncharacterized protein n=1 Tax=Portunus trituberculatus TaxID=210409 RepID=A0A5B7J6W0_PORTR|nr:hypothetical protein [Portunus trituberculatus]